MSAGTGIEVDLSQVTFRYRGAGFGRTRERVILEDFSLNCAPSKTTAVLGPSGCGKSTILDLVAGLKKPSHGTIRLFEDGHPAKPRLGFIFQRENCLPWLRIRHNLVFGLDGVPEHFNQVIERLNLKDLLGRFPHELSGGQQQRVAIGRLLVRRPNLVLCDEPWSSLDIAARRAVEHEVLSLVKQMAATCILVTHEPREALRLADRVVILAQRPVRIVYALEVTPAHRDDPVEVEKFVALYLDVLSGSGTKPGVDWATGARTGEGV